MEPITISLASRSYDGILPILRGEVTVPGIDLRVRLDNRAARVFAALFDGEVDVPEMSLAELVYYASRGKAHFTAIPVFPSRMFRHRHFFCTRASGIRGPADLNGCRIGFQRWVQTAGVWMRGILVENYGVSPRSQWHVAATHHWDDESEGEVQPRDGSTYNQLIQSTIGWA